MLATNPGDEEPIHPRARGVQCDGCGEVAIAIPKVEMKAPVKLPAGHRFPAVVCACSCSNWFPAVPRGYRLHDPARRGERMKR